MLQGRGVANITNNVTDSVVELNFGGDHDHDEDHDDHDHDHRLLSSLRSAHDDHDHDHDHDDDHEHDHDHLPASSAQALLSAAQAPMLVTLTVSAEAGSEVRSFWSDVAPVEALEWGFPVTPNIDIEPVASASTPSSVVLSIPHSFAVVPGAPIPSTSANCPVITYQIAYHSIHDHDDSDLHGSTCGAFVTANDTVTIAGIMPSQQPSSRCKQSIADAFSADSSTFEFRVPGLESGTLYHFDVRARNEVTGLELPYHPSEAGTSPSPAAAPAPLALGAIVAIVASACIVAGIAAVLVTRYACPRVVKEYVPMPAEPPASDSKSPGAKPALEMSSV